MSKKSAKEEAKPHQGSGSEDRTSLEESAPLQGESPLEKEAPPQEVASLEEVASLADSASSQGKGASSQAAEAGGDASLAGAGVARVAPENLGRWLPEFSLRRPVTVVMSFVALLVIGAIAYQRIPLQLFPSGLEHPFLYVRVIFPNSTPKEVEDQIVRPGEEILATVKGVRRMRSWASSHHGSFWIRFEEGSPMTLIYNQVRDRMERLMPTLPEGVHRYFIWKWNPDSQPVLYFGISMKRDVDDPYHLLEESLFQKLRRLSGVSKVDVWGMDQKQIWINVNQERARSHGVNLYYLSRMLRADNFSLASGMLHDGGRVFYLRSRARFSSLQQLRDYPVAHNVRLSDVADIRYGVDPEPRIYRINGRTGIFASVYKESEANTVALCEQIRQTISREFKSSREMAPFRVHYFFDQSKMIVQSIDNLKEAALWGGLFAVLILFFFLRRVRMTLMVTLAIPVSLLITLCILYFMGESLNVLTLMGLMLGVGMVVDNSIVVVENISRLRQANFSGQDAARYGASEVALAILLATSTTVVVFLPMILMTGSHSFRFYMGKIGYPVCFALGASLIVALIFIPLGASRLLRGDPPARSPFLEGMGNLYSRGLNWILLHRFDATLLMLLLFSSVLFPLNNVTRSHRVRSQITQFRLRFLFSKNYKFAEKDRYLRKIEKLLEEKSQKWGVENYTTRLSRYSSRGRVSVYLSNKRKEGVLANRRELAKQLGPLLPRAPGMSMRIGWRRVGGDSEATVSLHLYGPDSQTLEKLALRLESMLRKVPGMEHAEADIDRDSFAEIQLRVQRQQANRYQMHPLLIGGTVSYSLSGRRLRDFRIFNRDIPIWIRTRSRDRRSYQQLKNLPVLTGRNTGQGVPLSYVMRGRFSRSPRVIRRLNRKTYLKIKIPTTKRDLMGIYKRLNVLMQGFPLPPGYSWRKGFHYRDMRRADASRNFALILAITFVFLLMGVLFESFLLPFSVLLSVPFAFLGVYWTLYLTDTSMDLMTGIGLVLLIGIVVNNAIVLIDRINQLRQQGLERHEAILVAGKQRLRPILMTALTTICGLIPMAIGSSAVVGLSYSPLGRAVIGGLAASTLLSLFIVPLFYSFFDDLRHALMKLSSYLFS